MSPRRLVGSRPSSLIADRRPVRCRAGGQSVSATYLQNIPPRVPNAARGLVRNLDRYGGLTITERTIEFDHDAIEWRQ